MAKKVQGEPMTTEAIIETETKKKLSSSFYKEKSLAITGGVIRDTVSKALSELKHADETERVSLENTELVKEVSLRYLEACSKSESFPSMSGLARALGCGRRTLYYWIENKPSSPTSQWLVMCHDQFSDILTEGALRNCCNPVYTIFLQKSLFGLRDNTPPENNREQDDIENEQERQNRLEYLRQKYAANLVERYDE